MASIINASNSGFGGIVSTGDSSGVLQLQAAGTTIATIQSTGLNLSSNGLVFSDASTQTAAASPYVLKNRIINGAMVISQRNGTSTVTATNGAETFYTDRFKLYKDSGATITGQQSTTAPTGFTNSLLFTVSTGSSPTSAQEQLLIHSIEGFNIADLGWGTANAQTITLSFRVRSSVTGTFAGALQSSGAATTYVFNYVISSANTWETKTITISGPTTGTWLTTNGIGVSVIFDIGSGSNYETTPNTWTTGNKYRTSGAVQLAATTGATFYITGVQLEIGTSATPFERRLYGQELINCQRYCTLYSVTAINTFFGSGFSYNSTNALAYTAFPVTMRTSPTVTYSSTSHFGVYDGSAGTIVTTAITAYSSSPNAIGTRATVASGLTTGQGTMLKDNGTTSATILCTAEL